MKQIDFSIIIPHKDSLDCLPRLLNSIPSSSSIEIIIVDNSSKPISKEDINVDKEYKLLYSDPKRFAGGARNVGLGVASGKWLIFADADDFFTELAFDVFYDLFESDFDLIYFKSASVYDDTLTPSDRNLQFNKIIDRYISGVANEYETKFCFVVPWAKMIRKTIVDKYNLRFDEVVAANDVMFSVFLGFYSKKFMVDTHEVYVVTTRQGSLTNRQNLQVIQSRYNVALRRNHFLKRHGLGQYQVSVMIYIYMSFQYGFITFCSFLWQAIKWHQNIFIGCRNWLNSYKLIKRNNIKNVRYIVK